jgi:anti-sigma regulatory factor (Ser/Thr protein kinase)
VISGRAPDVPAPAAPWIASATPPFAAINTAPGLARGYVRATLSEWGLGEFVDDARVIASELVTNAVRASAPVLASGYMPVIRVCLVTDGDVLTIECWDQAPEFPVLSQADGLAESGRGLGIIDAITSGCWGCQPAIGQVGKCVWAKIPLTGRSTRRLPASPARPSLPSYPRKAAP